MAVHLRPLILGLAGFMAVVPASVHGQSAAPLEVVQKLPKSVAPGAAVPVEITLRNVGSLAVDGVQVIDDLPIGYDLHEAVPAPQRFQDRLSWTIECLPPGDERRFRLTLRPRPDAACKSVRNVVAVSYSARLSSIQVARVAGPVLALQVLAPERVPVGAPAVLTIAVRNQGDVAAHDVSLQTVLPAGLSNPQGSDLEVSVGTLEPGAERTLPLAVTPTRGGQLRARVTAQADGVAPVVREVSLQADDISFTVAPGGPAVLPQELTGLFELSVRNDASQACPVSVIVVLPEGIGFVRAADGGTYDRQTHSIRWDLGALAPGDSRVLAWNGLACKAGEMAYRVRVMSHDQVRQESSWTMRVIPAGAGPAR
jgi:uncharacterized repeat protein (TIGR01451 family)